MPMKNLIPARPPPKEKCSSNTIAIMLQYALQILLLIMYPYS